MPHALPTCPRIPSRKKVSLHLECHNRNNTVCARACVGWEAEPKQVHRAFDDTNAQTSAVCRGRWSVVGGGGRRRVLATTTTPKMFKCSVVSKFRFDVRLRRFIDF